MAKQQEQSVSKDGRPLNERIGSSEQLKMKARKAELRTIWAGFGMFGAIGWTIALPMLSGVLGGLWLDKRHPAPGRSWTLMLLVAGLVAGCAAAWSWVVREQRNMHKEE